MAKYDNGESTRKAIIASAHKLFYSNGLKNTTFSDIAQDSHVSKTSIVYHFKTKDSLNDKVSETVMEKIYLDVEKMMESPRMNMIFSSYIFWYQFFRDEHFRGWTLSSVEGSWDTQADNPWFRQMFDLLSHAYGLTENYEAFVRKNQFEMVSVGNVEHSLCQYVAGHLTEFHDFTEAAERETRMLSRLFGIPDEQIHAYLAEARQLLRSVDFSQIHVDPYELAGN